MGDGKDGKLCQVGDEFANVFNPVPVLRFKKFKVLYFSLGGTHSVVVAAKKSNKSSSGGFDDSDDSDEGGLMSDEDEMSKFDYLGGTSMLRKASMSGGRKSATLPMPGKMGGNKLSPRDRRRVKKIEEEKEKLSQTMPLHWTTRLGSLPDLSIPDLPEASPAPAPRIRTIESKPMADEDTVTEEIIDPDQMRKALHASAPDLSSLGLDKKVSEETQDETTDEYSSTYYTSADAKEDQKEPKKEKNSMKKQKEEKKDGTPK